MIIFFSPKRHPESVTPQKALFSQVLTRQSLLAVWTDGMAGLISLYPNDNKHWSREGVNTPHFNSRMSNPSQLSINQFLPAFCASPSTALPSSLPLLWKPGHYPTAHPSRPPRTCHTAVSMTTQTQRQPGEMPSETRQTDTRGRGAACQEYTLDLIPHVMDSKHNAVRCVTANLEWEPCGLLFICARPSLHVFNIPCK